MTFASPPPAIRTLRSHCAMTEENMGERMWRRTVTELSSYPTELDAPRDADDQRRVRFVRYTVVKSGRFVCFMPSEPRTRYLRFLSRSRLPMRSCAVSRA